ncbi:hypothetical protein GCM10010361_52750 [Streptomyces olivaceiscleroticus]|uniref:Uncharacterized protein n=1 Tax=Streptomyces olivaceiscleroticus TaxID=68245 RepID=A0ABN1APT5_9ACTN
MCSAVSVAELSTVTVSGSGAAAHPVRPSATAAPAVTAASTGLAVREGMGRVLRSAALRSTAAVYDQVTVRQRSEKVLSRIAPEKTR